MSKYEWSISIKGRQYQVKYVNGSKTAPELKGLFVDNCRIAQPVEKTFGLYRLNHEFTINSEKIILQMYATSCDLIMDGVYVKHKISANRNVLDWSAWIGFLIALLSFSVPIVFGFEPLFVVLTAVAIFGNIVIALSPFYRGYKKVIFNIACLALLWLVAFWMNNT